MRYILALDQGTTSSRAIVFDSEGKVVSSAQKEFRQIFPQPGWVEHDPHEIWSSQSAVAAEALAIHDTPPVALAAVGITNQRETTIVWNRKTGEPVYNAIVWQDRRTASMCDRMRQDGLEDTIRAKTGLVIDPYFSGTKVRWILENVRGVRAQAERGELAFGTVDSWLVWKLTGGARHVTDASNASRTMLFNIHSGEWDAELLEALQIPRTMLPEVASCSEVYGNVASEIFARGTPIAGMAGDQQAALFGQSCFAPGMAKNTYGTGCFLLMNTSTQARVSANQLVTTVAWKIGGTTEYALEGSVFVAGAVIQWLRDGLGLIENSSEADTLAGSVPDNGGVFFVPAFTGLGAPHWDPYARGAIVGLTRGTTSAHVARAAIEAIAFQSYDVLLAMERDSGIALSELRVDGGAVRSDLLLQFQSDLLGVPVVRPRQIETTAQGAAYLAGLATGVWTDREEIARKWTLDRVFEPSRSRDEMLSLHHNWKRAVSRASGWIESDDQS
jgi:glycerol kinase